MNINLNTMMKHDITNLAEYNAKCIFNTIFPRSKSVSTSSFHFFKTNNNYVLSTTLTCSSNLLEYYDDNLAEFKINNKDIMEFITIKEENDNTTDYYNAFKLKISIIFNENADQNLLLALLKVKNIL